MNQKYFNTILLLFCFLFLTTIQAQQKEVLAIDCFVKKVLKRFPYVPELTITVVKDNKSLIKKGYGFSDLKNNVKTDIDIPFYIASTTKSFVSMVAIILENEGKIDLSLPLTTYKPFKNLSNKQLFESVTIKELLNHTSGLQNHFLTFRNAYIGNKPHEDMLMLLEEKRLT